MISRRRVLQGLAALAVGGMGLAGYGFGLEPMRTVVTRYRVAPRAWPARLQLKMAVLADIHACEPWMAATRIRSIVEMTNAMKPDITVLLGDYAAGHKWVSDRVDSDKWAPELGRLRAPLGVHAILGNHDWWDDFSAQRKGGGPVIGRIALERAGVPVYENDAVRLVKDGQPFWIAGLGDQLALIMRRLDPEIAARHREIRIGGFATGDPAINPHVVSALSARRGIAGVHDLERTLAKVTDDAPIIMLAHEPDIFPVMPPRVALTLSGHTHGGQVRIAGYSPVVPSRYGSRYAYGHIVEPRGHLVVSGGLGNSIVPVRFGVPPEIVVVELGAA